MDDFSDSISFQSDRSEAYHERKALQLSDRFHGQCPDRSNNDRDSDSNPVSSPVSGPNLSEMLETRPAVEPTVVDDTQDVKSPTTKVFIITPLGHQDFFYLSARTRGLDIVREKGCLVRWEASSLYLTHSPIFWKRHRKLRKEIPCLVFQLRSEVGQSSSTTRPPCGTDVPSEALSGPRPIKVFFIIPTGDSGTAHLEPSTTGRDIISRNFEWFFRPCKARRSVPDTWA